MTEAQLAAAVEKVKVALRTTTDDEGLLEEIEDNIKAALTDLGIAGVDGANAVITDDMVLQAVKLYCKCNVGDPDNYDRYKRSYDEIKATLRMATGWTNWNRTAA